MSNDMSDEEDILDELVAADVLKLVQGDDIELSEEFLSAYESIASEIDDLGEDERRSLLQKRLSSLDRDEPDLDDRTASLVLALVEFKPEFSSREALRIAASLNRFFDPPPRDEIPNGFMLLRPNDVDAFFEQNDVTVLYVYRDNSSTCSAVCDILGDLSGDVLNREDVGLGAMYGPDGKSYLREELDVQMSPTILVLDGDSVVLRLVGQYDREYFEDELTRAIDACN